MSAHLRKELKLLLSGMGIRVLQPKEKITHEFTGVRVWHSTKGADTCEVITYYEHGKPVGKGKGWHAILRLLALYYFDTYPPKGEIFVMGLYGVARE